MVFDPRWKTGHIPDPILWPIRFAEHEMLSGAAIFPSARVDLRDSAPPVRQQLVLDCCAHGTADNIVMNGKADGVDLPPPSVLALYDVSQFFLRPQEPLRDEGTSLSAMFLGASEYGTAREEDWPEIPENVGVVPPDDVMRAAEEGKVRRYHQIDDGAASSLQIVEALRRRRTSTICFLVDEKFANIGGDVYVSPGGKVIGSHCMLVVGYEPSIDAFIIRNSWGTDFGDLGYALVSSNFVNLKSYGKYVTDLGPEKIR